MPRSSRTLETSHRGSSASRRLSDSRFAKLEHEVLEDRRLLAVNWQPIEPLGSLMYQSDIIGGLGTPVSIFSDDFESGTLGTEWSTSSSVPEGRIEVSNVLGTPANSGSFHLAMDSTVAGTASLNEAVLSLNLSGLTNVSLAFAHKDVNDEDNALPTTFVGSFDGDGVSISEDGNTWHALVSLNNANSPNNTYTDFNFDLDAAAATAGISLGPDFQIKFQQFDNFTFNTDGRTFDDVVVMAAGTGGLTETTTAFLEKDQTLTVVATPDDPAATLSVIVRDPGSGVLASATAAGPGETVDIQTIGIGADGDYTVEVTSDNPTQYELSLFRNATVEVVDTDDGNEQDATGSFIPLGSGRFGIVGQFDAVSQAAQSVVWAVQPSSGNILKLDPVSGAILDTFPTPDALAPTQIFTGLSIAEDGGSLLYINDSSPTALYRLDPDDGSILSTEIVPADAFRAGLSFESGTPDSIFIVNNGAKIDRQAGFGGALSPHLTAGITFPGAIGGDDNGRQFAARSGQIQEYDPVTPNTIINAFADPAGPAPLAGMAFDGLHLYASDLGGNLLTIDPDTGAVLNVVTIPGGPLTGLGADIVAGPLLPAPVSLGFSNQRNVYGDPGEPGRFPPGPSAAAAAVAPNELLANGSFETGDFSGWTTVTTSLPFRPWAVTGSGQGGGFGMLQTQPQDGAFAAWNGFDGVGPMEFQMFQDVAITGGGTATLSWMDRVQWNFTLGATATVPRLYDVEIRDPVTNAVLQTVFSFSTGTQATNPTGNTNWQTHSVDVSAFAGQTVRVFFRQQIPQNATGPGQIEFDAISLTVDDGTVPVADVDEYLLDLSGKAGEPIDIVLSSEVPLADVQFNESQTQQNNVFTPNVLSFDFGSAPAPAGDATLMVTALADLDLLSEFLTLDAEGLLTQDLFATGGLQQQLVSTTVVIPQAILAQLAADGTVSFTVTPSAAVNNLGANSLTLDLSYSVLAAPDITLEVLDTAGASVLATGIAFPEKFDVGILDFVVPADGVYTVRVASDKPGGYSIVVTDPLMFETEPNAPGTAGLRFLDEFDGALGFLGDGPVGAGDLNLIQSFEALRFPSDSGFIPPDPILAAGPQSVVAMVNTDIAIYDKTTGNELAKADLDGGGGFWATSNVVFDPWIMFDEDSDRFFALGVDRTSTSSRIYLAVSTDSTPTNLTTDWHKYIIDRTGTHQVSGVPTFPDYPKMGVNDDAIYVTGNDFGISSGGFSHVSLFAIEKAPLLAGGAANIVHDEVITGAFSVHPVINYDSGSTMYFADAVGTTGIRLHALSNVLTTPVRTTSTVAVSTFLFPPDVPQQGGAPLDSVSQRIMSGVVRDGSLWTAHAIVDPAVDGETVVRWYEFDVSAFPGVAPTVVQSGNVDPGPGVHTWMAHINVDVDGDMGIGFSVSGPTMFASIGYTGRLASDAPGTTRPVQIARAGEGSYERFDGIGRNRWGDYSGLAIDPDGQTFWLYNEYAAAGNNWATFVGAFQVTAGAGPVDQDAYNITLTAGQTISLHTTTPFDDPTDGINLADPNLEILDPSGAPVAFDSGSGPDGKNAAIASFTAASPGTYQVVVSGDADGAGEYVLSVNWAPELKGLALSELMIIETESILVSGSYSDNNSGDSHEIVVDWDDPNDPVDSTFFVGPFSTLTVGDTFNSSTDAAVLEITALDPTTGTVSFTAGAHQYDDDGIAPGNGTPADTSTIDVTITDVGGLTAATLAQQFLTNGGFETGDFTGWTVVNHPGGGWNINDGSLDPAGPNGPVGPISGNFDALSVQTTPGLDTLSQTFVVPPDVSSVMLSWSDRIRNQAGVFNEPQQEFRVKLNDDGGGLIQEVFSTDPGDPLQQLGPNNRVFDLTALFDTLGGQTVELAFEMQAILGFFNVSLDDVSLLILTETDTDLLVKNVDPEFVPDSLGSAAAGATVALSAGFTDAGLLDRHTVIVDWGDSTTSDSNLNPGDFPTFVDSTGGGIGTFTAQHIYATGGIFTVTVTLIDDDTGQATAQTRVFPAGVRLTPDGILEITGSEQNDRVTIAKTFNQLTVFANFLNGANSASFNTGDVNKIVAYLFAGNDHFVISSNVAVPAIVHGGAGDDLLKGGGGPTALLGEDGNDRVIGGNARDILIGGLGADLLMGGLDQDLLIAGTTIYDQDDLALMDLIAEWNANDSYEARVDKLRNGAGPTGIKLAVGETVFDDLESDRLVGAAGRDWFFANLLQDVLPDRQNNEDVN